MEGVLPETEEERRLGGAVLLRRRKEDAGRLSSGRWTGSPGREAPAGSLRHLLRPGLDQLRRPGIVRSSSPIHSNHITPGLNRQGRLLVRLEPETSPFNSSNYGRLSPIELQLNW
ncbi:hypothetical protein LXL04_003830 [Taraxacum kok-saghyz]